MRHRALSLIVGLLVLASAALVTIEQGSGGAASPAATPASPTPPPSPASPAASPASQSNRAGDRFENVRVLQDISTSDFYATMHLIRASLGTTCDHCHDVEHYEADTKPAKVTARRHMQMVIDLNKTVFEGRTAVTCNSCHRGSSQTVALPTVEQGLFPDSTRGAAVTSPQLPTPAQVLDRYVAAVGGRDALLRLKSRAAEGTWAHMGLTTAADGHQAAVNVPASAASFSSRSTPKFSRWLAIEIGPSCCSVAPVLATPRSPSMVTVVLPAARSAMAVVPSKPNLVTSKPSAPTVVTVNGSTLARFAAAGWPSCVVNPMWAQVPSAARVFNASSASRPPTAAR
jgi:hypothetical protein